MLASFEKKIKVQPQRQIGESCLSRYFVHVSGLKINKKSGITFKMRGRLNTYYGPPTRMSNIFISEGKAKINQPESYIVKLALCYQFLLMKFNRDA